MEFIIYILIESKFSKVIQHGKEVNICFFKGINLKVSL